MWAWTLRTGLGLGCGMAIFLFLPGTPRLVIGYLQRKGKIAVLFISTPSDFPYVPIYSET